MCVAHGADVDTIESMEDQRHVARVGQHDWWRASPPFRSTPLF